MTQAPAASHKTNQPLKPPRRRRVLGLLLAALLVTAGVVAVADLTRTEPTSRYAAPAAQAVTQVSQGAALLDVRTQEEWDQGHAKGAVLLPLDQIQNGSLPDAAKTKEIFVYCASGRRAGIAVELLRNAGYRDVTNIGGLTDWENAGGPLAPT